MDSNWFCIDLQSLFLHVRFLFVWLLFPFKAIHVIHTEYMWECYFHDFLLINVLSRVVGGDFPRECAFEGYSALRICVATLESVRCPSLVHLQPLSSWGSQTLTDVDEITLHWRCSQCSEHSTFIDFPGVRGSITTR